MASPEGLAAEAPFKPFLRGASTSRGAASRARAWALGAMLAPGAAAFGAGGDAELCVAGTGNRDLDVAVCGRALRAEDLPPPTRATLHVARGRAYAAAGRLARAVADFDAAIALLPVSADAYHHRGLARIAERRYAAAVADLDRAVALFPRHAAAIRDRGVAWFLDGDLERAATDLNTAIALDDDDAQAYAFRGFVHYECTRHAAALRDWRAVAALGYPYDHLSLWLHLAARRVQEDGRDALRETLAMLGEDAWPGPLVAAFLGRTTEAQVLAAAARAHPPLRARRTAEARFYLGELARLGRDAAAAQRHYRGVVEAGAPGTVEHAMAVRRLEHAGEGLVGGADTGCAPAAAPAPRGRPPRP